MNSHLYLENIINTYKQEKNDSDSSQQSIHWEKYNKKKDNKFLNPDNLINFRKNKILSDGLDDSELLRNKRNLRELIDTFDSEFIKKNLPKKNIGNCHNSINFKGGWFDLGLFHLLKRYERIQKYIQNNFFVLEIGGGFGEFSRIILNNKNVKYFLIDLPESNLMCNYYLQSHFPQKKIFNYSDYKKYKLEDNIKNFDIFILPSRTLVNQDIKFDFIINTSSFMEMNKDIIHKYFDMIQNKTKQSGYFLNINRYMKNSVNEEIKFDEYPYDNLWNVEISEEAYLLPGAHLLLVKRTSEKGNIENELLKIKNISLLKNARLKILKENFFWFVKKSLFTILKFIFTLLLSSKILKKLSNKIYNISERPLLTLLFGKKFLKKISSIIENFTE